MAQRKTADDVDRDLKFKVSARALDNLDDRIARIKWIETEVDGFYVWPTGDTFHFSDENAAVLYKLWWG